MHAQARAMITLAIENRTSVTATLRRSDPPPCLDALPPPSTWMAKSLPPTQRKKHGSPLGKLYKIKFPERADARGLLLHVSPFLPKTLKPCGGELRHNHNGRGDQLQRLNARAERARPHLAGSHHDVARCNHPRQLLSGLPPQASHALRSLHDTHRFPRTHAHPDNPGRQRPLFFPRGDGSIVPYLRLALDLLDRLRTRTRAFSRVAS